MKASQTRLCCKVTGCAAQTGQQEGTKPPPVLCHRLLTRPQVLQRLLVRQRPQAGALGLHTEREAAGSHVQGYGGGSLGLGHAAAAARSWAAHPGFPYCTQSRRTAAPKLAMVTSQCRHYLAPPPSPPPDGTPGWAPAARA